MRRTNPLREKLKARQPTMGTRLHIAWPTIIELVGHSGAFDYVEILAEYAPYDAFSLENQGRAIDLFDHMSGLIKLAQEDRAHGAVRALNAGIQNIMFTDIRSVEEARACIRMVKAESPHTGGVRGVGQGRDVGNILEIGSPFYVQTTADTVIAVMIEKREAVENLDAILDLPEIDLVQFGGADYSMSLGLTGQRAHPSVTEAHDYTIKTALAKGKHPRAEIGHPDQAERYLNMGVRDFCMGTDIRTLFSFYKEHGTRLHDMLAAAGPR